MLLDFLEQAQLGRVGCFAYSPVEGAAANALADPVPEALKQERLARFMGVQAKISSAKLARKVGKSLTVLVDGVRDGMAVARSSADAPEIDGVVYIEGAPDLRPGDFRQVSITRAGEHDLWGRLTR